MRCPLSSMPLGTTIHNVELKPGKGGQLIRSAGGSAQVMGRDGEYVQVRLRSGEMRKILSTCMATVGQVGNTDHENINVGKAGRVRWLGRRPNVRGVVMNPVDHPHETEMEGGLCSVNGDDSTEYTMPLLNKCKCNINL